MQLPLNNNSRFDGEHGADSRAFTAALAPIVSPPDYVGEILDSKLVIII
jgi:hypothetical protein